MKSSPLSVEERSIGAFVGAAVGDALGWPYEIRSGNIERRQAAEAARTELTFHRWRRFSGTRYAPFHEPIEAGEYSDDTQLLCASARSRLAGDAWWDVLTKVELPAWLLYERGGGTAVKRAARAWMAGHPPWVSDKRTTPEEVDSYFTAGANGVAMRILPHCVVGALDPDFSRVAASIVTDGIATHGHPRALLGGLVYGYACWSALRTSDTLEYGALLGAIARGDDWAGLPGEETLPRDWIEAFPAGRSTQLAQVWETTVEEVRALLGKAAKGLDQGALASEREVLQDLGCRNRSVNGSGTVTAVAAIYLASRFAADPLAGLREAAFLPGGDTDTLASMTAALLGSILGVGWMQELASTVEDHEYLKDLAQRVASFRTSEERKKVSPRRVTRGMIETTWHRLASAGLGDEVVLPDGRRAELQERQELDSSSKKIHPWNCRLRATDGQTLHLTRAAREDTLASSPPLPPSKRERQSGDSRGRTADTPETSPASVTIGRIGIKLSVASLAASRRFYEETIGLTPSRVNGRLVNFGEVLSLVERPESVHHSGLTRERQLVFIELQPVAAVFDAVRRGGYTVFGWLDEQSGRRFFRCLDPDGYLIEVYETIPPDSSGASAAHP